jgi:hypothetical protein
MSSTDPSRLTVVGVRRRDGYACIICGSTRQLTTQHRVARGMGGSLPEWINGPANLITLCGSGTTGCHGWVEAHPMFSREAGWSVRRGLVLPADVPVLYPEGWVLLTDDRFDVRPITVDDACARGLSLSRPRGRGVPVDDPDVGGSWPPDTARPTAAANPVRPWGSPVGG